MPTIHHTAIIEPGTEIDDDVTIGPYCVIGPQVRLGAGTVLHNHVTLSGLTTIGFDNEIFPFAVLGAAPQDLKFDGEPTRTIIGDRNQIREHATIHRGTIGGGGVTRIGDDNLLMVAAHVAHDCHVHDHTVIANSVMLAGHVIVHSGASIGGGAGIHHFATVGRLSFVGALGRISKDVPPFMMVEGHPAIVRAVNTMGLVRRGFPERTIDALKIAHRMLYRDGQPANEAMEELEERYPHIPEIQELIGAVRRSGQGTYGRFREILRRDNKFRAPAR
ncbi:MAG: acyl-ACP--UDP-N-acetylglucosamine O-acyltransferase [Phycisphaerales bacterium]|nr:acyl-ACP--UDP-N-acetylglucosamine O-acyltransferase [Phycisphaerales bacterium]